MGRRRWLALLTVLLLVSAGCQSTSPEPPTVTPVPVPTVSETVDTRDIPGDHREALQNRSYRTTVTLQLRYPDGSTGRVTDEFNVGADGDYRFERRHVGRYPGQPQNRTVWQTGSTEFVRQSGDDGDVTVRSGTSSGLADPTLSGFLAQLLQGFDLAGQRTADGQTLRDTQDSVRTLPLPLTVHNAQNVTVGVVIRDDVVRSLIVSADADRGADDEPVRVRIVFAVEDIGHSEPTRPPWATTERAGG